MPILSGVSAADRYGLAILTIFVNYVIATAVRGEVGAAWATLSALLTIWLVFTVSQAPGARRAAALAIPVSLAAALVMTIAHRGRQDTLLQVLLVVANMVLYAIAPVVIVRHIFRRRAVDRQTMFGAIAAYLLIGMSFAYAYSAIGAVQDTPPLFGTSGSGTMPQVLFFSFVTLTTTGYGNLVPAGNPAQTLAVIEAILGQLFLVIAVAKVVTAWRLPAEEEEPDPGVPA